MFCICNASMICEISQFYRHNLANRNYDIRALEVFSDVQTHGKLLLAKNLDDCLYLTVTVNWFSLHYLAPIDQYQQETKLNIYILEG